MHWYDLADSYRCITAKKWGALAWSGVSTCILGKRGTLGDLHNVEQGSQCWQLHRWVARELLNQHTHTHNGCLNPQPRDSNSFGLGWTLSSSVFINYPHNSQVQPGLETSGEGGKWDLGSCFIWWVPANHKAVWPGLRPMTCGVTQAQV